MTLAEAGGPAITLESRVERKYVLPQPRTAAAAGWLRHACRPAAEFADGIVTSCYFDTPDLEAYFGSADGEWEKTKVRVRWYDEQRVPGTGFRASTLAAFLELKGGSSIAS